MAPSLAIRVFYRAVQNRDRAKRPLWPLEGCRSTTAGPPTSHFSPRMHVRGHDFPPLAQAGDREIFVSSRPAAIRMGTANAR